MANWAILKKAIASAIKTNGNQEITGAVLQNTIYNIINSVGKNATFAGIATPATNPGTQDGPVFYFTVTPGIYPNFNGLEVENQGLSILYREDENWKSLSVYALVEGDGNVIVTPIYEGGEKIATINGISIYAPKSTVDVTPILTSGTHIATINGVRIYAPVGGGTASVDVTPILTSGTHIATINGVRIYAPVGGGTAGASTWAELAGKPSWLTDNKPAVSYFDNDAGYLTSAALSGYATTSEVDYKDEQVLTSVAQSYGKSLGANGKYLRLLNKNGIELNKVIAPYATYTDQLGATDSTSDVSIYGEVKMKNGSLAVAGDVTVAGSLSVTGESHFSSSVYIGDAANVSAKYLWFGYRGIFFEGEGATSGNPWYGTLCTHDAYTHKSINLRCFNGWTQINQLAVGQNFLTGAPSPSYTLDVLGTLRASTSVKTGDCYANYFILSDNDGTYDYGRIVTPAWKARIDMSEAYNGMIALACGGAEYLSMNAAEGVIRSLKELYITHDDGLRIGDAYLRYDSVNNALYVTGQNGAQVHLYATGGIAGYSGLGSGIKQLANLQLTGQLTAQSAAFTGMMQASKILLDNFTIDTNNEYLEIRYNGLDYAENQLVLDVYGDIYSEGYLYVNGKTSLNETYIGSQASTYKITGIYADGINVYITINGKKYKLANA